MKQCPVCHNYCDDFARFCPNCGAQLGAEPGSGATPPPVYDSPADRNNPFDSCGPEGKSRGVAALLAIFLGYLGVQYFYLGKTQAGIITIVLSLVTCGVWELITLIQGILMLCMTNEEFRRKYVTTTSTFPLF
ncbi:MAG: TM2 domain-containing protein [Bacteroidales bacterium]|nr:TM2 domain-containing protein [Bacteroidales bacterium]MBD5216468.1 TM2 domain-containing protein [Bacteroidales bacterium]